MGYDIIVVGCGNAACAFLAKYLKSPRATNERIAVIEEGRDFFEVSDMAHQRNWIKSFSESNIFKLRNTVTEDDVPIISARGCCVGGGGSINYTMITEDSSWLAEHLGRDAAYWDERKHEIHASFGLLPPTRTQITERVLNVVSMAGFQLNNSESWSVPNFTLQSSSGIESADSRFAHRFPVPFNKFGQRTHSGASIVDLNKPNVDLFTRTLVTELKFEKISPSTDSSCIAVCAQNLDTKKKHFLEVNQGGKVILSAGSTTPQLLLPYKKILGNSEIGNEVSDHVLIPLGVYVVDDSIELSARDFYIPVFATGEWTSPSGKKQVYCFDFHSGVLESLWFILAHLFLGFVFPNSFKRYMIRFEPIFRVVTNAIHGILRVITLCSFLLGGFFNIIRGKPWNSRLKLIVATLKYQAAFKGCYEEKRDKIVLGWFKKDDDGFCADEQIAKDIIKQNISMLNSLGTKPPWIVRMLIRLFIGMPYTEKDVDAYVEKYKEKYLLSQLHLAGGCDVGRVCDNGEDDTRCTGLVKGSQNVHVADLSAVPLPRISPQMTAYLMGNHIATSFI